MQFKHPEILWALLLLLIPIIIHLLRLRRFKKTLFTNVVMLKRVVAEAQKSREFKKWLLLCTRLLLLAALVTAFAQPFTSKPNALTKSEVVVYLDNSFSMTTKSLGITLLQKAVQDLIQEIPEATTFTLFTNNRTFRNVTAKQIQNDLLTLEASPSQLTLDQIALKATSLFSDSENLIKEAILLSDLQGRTQPTYDFNKDIRFSLTQFQPDKNNNVYIDSIYLGKKTGNQIALHVQVIGLASEDTAPIALYNSDTLIAKTAVKGNASKKSISILSLEDKKAIKGRIVIEDPTLRYDNQLFFNIDTPKKPKVFIISEADSRFLERIYSKVDFEYQSANLKSLNYSLLGSQDMIVLNGLKTVPNNLSRLLIEFYKDGRTLVIIPSSELIDKKSYNDFLGALASIQFQELLAIKQDISAISFQHKLYENVFEREVTNFDYPQVNAFYDMNAKVSTLLHFSDQRPFLLSADNTYVFTASLATENSNFINSPLVVPTFYNMGEYSLKRPSLYETIGTEKSIDVPHRIGADNILKLRNAKNEYIPLQQSFSNKIRLQFDENPTEDGIYGVYDGANFLQNISFNYPRYESKLNYLLGNTINGISTYEEISELFENMREDTAVTDFWKWFVILATFLTLLELLLQKLLP